MAVLRDSNNDILLSKHMIGYVTPAQDITEVTHVLLNGEIHLATIGNARKSFSFDVQCDGNMKQTLDAAAASKEELKFVRHGTSHDTVISGNISWDLIRPGRTLSQVLYIGKVTLLVT